MHSPLWRAVPVYGLDTGSHFADIVVNDNDLQK
jgi:hypothetical protein